MRPVRTANALLCLILAASFAIMSLGHGPIMAFAAAKAPGAAHEITAGPAAGHHHHGAAQAAAGSPPAHERAAICYPAGCFLAVAPVAVGITDSPACLLGRLRAAAERPLIASIPDPLVPPPRQRA
jgi:hypothetical protein